MRVSVVAVADLCVAGGNFLTEPVDVWLTGVEELGVQSNILRLQGFKAE